VNASSLICILKAASSEQSTSSGNATQSHHLYTDLSDSSNLLQTIKVYHTVLTIQYQKKKKIIKQQQEQEEEEVKKRRRKKIEKEYAKENRTNS